MVLQYTCFKVPKEVWHCSIPVVTVPEDEAQEGVGAGRGQGLHEVGDGGHQLGGRGVLVD